MEKIEVTIIGAGIIGLALGWQLSKKYKDNLLIVEKNFSFGQETSSRNSEVIHAGIYYPKDSLKAKTCMEGKNLLYEFASKYNIPHKRLGKLIVAKDKEEIKILGKLFEQAKENGLKDLVWLTKEKIKLLEPYVEAEQAMYSPSTGIIDTHKLMDTLQYLIKQNQANIIYNTEVVEIEKNPLGYKVIVKEPDGNYFDFLTSVLINCSGLHSDKILKMLKIEKEEYKLKYCKGSYFRINLSKAYFIKHLVYPVPKRTSLGIHATLDMAGSLRLGPDDEYVREINYEVEPSKSKLFYNSIKEILPFIKEEDLFPDIAGIRPKLQKEDELFRDFIIKEESSLGLNGFINLLGIESPGLTACLSIAKIVEKYLFK